MYEREAAVWRRRFLEVVAKNADKPLCLSGGTDSVAVLAAQLELGHKPVCYGFKLEGPDSGDVRVSKMLAQRYDLDYRLVTIPRDVDLLAEEVREVIGVIKSSKKTLIQCAHPAMYLARAVRADGYAEVMSGVGGVMDDSRALAVLLHREGEEAARTFRRKSLYNVENTATGAMFIMFRHEGVEFLDPYRDPDLAEYALSLDMSVICHPVQKGIAVRAFPDAFWRTYRTNSPLQTNSGLKEYHDVLLSSRHNRRGSKAIVGVYNDMRREVLGA